jgi:hypothetical protein
MHTELIAGRVTDQCLIMYAKRDSCKDFLTERLEILLRSLVAAPRTLFWQILTPLERSGCRRLIWIRLGYVS